MTLKKYRKENEIGERETKWLHIFVKCSQRVESRGEERGGRGAV